MLRCRDGETVGCKVYCTEAAENMREIESLAPFSSNLALRGAAWKLPKGLTVRRMASSGGV